MTRAFWGAYAHLPGGVGARVRLRVADGVIVSVETGVPAGDAEVLPGIVLPGFANAHSHAFHRALRGRTHDRGGTFWTWRERMYAVAQRLDPDSYLALARAAYAEMALAGVTAVGEFHYLHHGPGGVPYANPNAMAAALRQAAADAGLRLTLLDACYLAGGFGAGLDPVQERFSDGDADAWATRVGALRGDGTFRVGAAVHSVRAVPREQLPVVAEAARGRPLHVHLSEQPAENEACLTAHGLTPSALLGEAGILGERTTAVHATHLTGPDVALLGRTGTAACFCPTTERDLADGLGPAGELAAAGVRLALGSDQHAVTDLLEEARALEMHERLRTGERGRFTPAALVRALTRQDVLGGARAGIEAGAPADLVAVRTDTVRTAGADPAQVVLAATAADVDTVIVGGNPVVRGGRHRLGDVGALLRAAIDPLWSDR
ncbi:MAG: formimidoylglutamate deiminase [Pseudonocardia sp.]|nr:formimidoylglutamate deiminase [Pseudonocardia sp.]